MNENVKYWLSMGNTLFYGCEGVNKNPEKARKWFEMAAEAGNEEAAKMLKEHYDYDAVIDIDKVDVEREPEDVENEPIVVAPTEYEKSQVRAIVEWKNQEPSVVSKGFSMIAKPFEFVVSKVIPQSAMEGALNAANSAGQFLADEGDICRDGNVSNIESLRHKSLEVSDSLANNVHNWAITTAAAEGGVTGATGVAGIVVDVPAILTLALRTIHKIGLCYGYRADTLEEKNFVLDILSAAGANSQKEKVSALVALQTLRTIIAKQTWKSMQNAGEKEAMILMIKALCKQLGVNLTKRKALQAIPVIGGGVGAAVNGSFMRDVGYAARRIYQQRWLQDNNKWDDNTAELE